VIETIQDGELLTDIEQNNIFTTPQFGGFYFIINYFFSKALYL
jgi:hypothetical protein